MTLGWSDGQTSGVTETPEVGELRRQAARQTAGWLASFGLLLWRSNLVDDAVAGVAVVTQMVGQLGQGAVDAFDRDRFYAGSCMTRQLVEAHYLLLYFATDVEQAARWRRASKNRLEKSFRPSKLRHELGADGGDYQVHCALGGHPTPQAAWLLPDHKPLVDREVSWVDLQQHLTDAVHASLNAAKELGDRLNGVPGVTYEEPPAIIAHWIELDPLARRVNLTDAARIMGRYLISPNGSERPREAHRAVTGDGGERTPERDVSSAQFPSGDA